MQITASYTRTLNHDQYGGQPYENSKHMCSLTTDVLPDDADEALVKLEQSRLMEIAKHQTKQSVENEIMGLAGGLPKAQFNAILDGYLKGDSMTSDDYAGMSPVQQMIIQAIKRSKKRTK